MKFSKHNAIVLYGADRYALYNSFHQRVLFMEPALKELLEAGIQEGIDAMESIHPQFYNYLKEQEFLLPEETDEVEMVKELSRKVDNGTDSYFLTINPSMNCNFKCWYCYETHVKGSSLTSDIISRINAFCTKTLQAPNLKQFSLSFFGGEPLLYFKRDVTPIIDHVLALNAENPKGLSISFTTNGYLINEDFISYFKSRNAICSLQITLDGYGDAHDAVRFVSQRKGSYKEIITNIRLLITNGFFVRLRVNYTDKNIGEADKIALEFADIEQSVKDRFLFFDFHRVWQNDQLDDTDGVLEEKVRAIRTENIRVSSKNSPNNVHDSCYADKRNSAVINYNGDIFKCTARDFTTVKRAGYLDETGEIVWEGGYLDRRMSAKFHNRPCLSCKIMPLCNGGCSQHALEGLESGEDYCVYHGSEEEKDKVIRTKIEEMLIDAAAV